MFWSKLVRCNSLCLRNHFGELYDQKKIPLAVLRMAQYNSEASGLPLAGNLEQSLGGFLTAGKRRTKILLGNPPFGPLFTRAHLGTFRGDERPKVLFPKKTPKGPYLRNNRLLIPRGGLIPPGKGDNFSPGERHKGRFSGSKRAPFFIHLNTRKDQRGGGKHAVFPRGPPRENTF